jgi:hypothetical protein
MSSSYGTKIYAFARGSTLDDSLPTWVDYMINIGRWMRSQVNQERRLFLAVLLPARYCCSSFCSLGANIAGASKSSDFLNWDQVLALNEGTIVYLIYGTEGNRKPFEGVIRDVDEYGGKRINIKKVRKNRGKGIPIESITLSIFPKHIDQYRISLMPHASRKKIKQLDYISPFYRNILKGFNDIWMDNNSPEVLIVANKTSWYGQIEDIVLRTAPDKDYDLKNLLMIGEDVNSPAHTLLIAPNSFLSPVQVPLVILDGPEALRRWEALRNSNVIILLDQSEYGPESMNILSMLGHHHQDSLMPNEEDIPKSPLSGSETVLFALPVIED